MSLPTLACEVKELRQVQFFAGDVFVAGDLKIKIVKEEGSLVAPNSKQYLPSGYVVTIDLKAGDKYIKRGIQLKVDEMFTDTICKQEVSIVFESTSRFKVTAFYSGPRISDSELRW
ncbi:MAG: hypothetical protein PHU06_14190 [Gallionella sp.]|nr:hypothetical protein [Gallionella sp.]MDD4960412.1 hypothetical protein [Gallionella sp.]